MYYAYILQLKDKSYYHGSAADLKERLNDHTNGIVSSTKNLRPFKLVFYAAFVSKKKAMQFEKYLKTTSGWAFRNKHLIEKSSQRCTPTRMIDNNPLNFRYTL